MTIPLTNTSRRPIFAEQKRASCATILAGGEGGPGASPVTLEITALSGQMGFAYVHIVWFGLWILLNTGRVGMRAFDPFPYGLLTMIVSLEAIFLSTVVLISQNRLSGEIERRADLDLHIGLLTEHELTRVLQMLDAIQRKMGIDDDEASLRTSRWKPSPKTCWRKSSAFNSVDSAGKNLRHEPEPKDIGPVRGDRAG
jgi:uncharacterized membrane protein